MLKTRKVKLGTHRGNRRIWLEGQWLLEAGFTPGDNIYVVVSKDETETREHGFVLYNREPKDTTGVIAHHGLVSGKIKNDVDVPVIDINSAKVGTWFDADVERLEVRPLGKGRLGGTIRINAYREDD